MLFLGVDRISLNAQVPDDKLMAGGETDGNVLMAYDVPALGDEADFRRVNSVLLDTAQDDGKKDLVLVKVVIILADELGILG